MNNRFKFRVYNKKRNQWVHGPNEEVHLFGENILLGGFMKRTPVEELNDCIIQQYTGLNDIDNNTIYEGDIVELRPAAKYSYQGIKENHYGLYEVYWDKKYKLREIKSNPILKTNRFLKNIGFDCANFNIMKVIGNIFDTPELLK